MRATAMAGPAATVVGGTQAVQEAQAVETEVRVAQVVDSVVQVANLAAGTVGAVLAVLQVAVAGLQEVMVDNLVVEEVTTVVAVEKMGASAAMEEVVKAVAVMEAAVGVEEEVALMGGLGRGTAQSAASAARATSPLCYQGARQSAPSALPAVDTNWCMSKLAQSH